MAIFWRGFLIESMSYMNYRTMTAQKRLVFWWRFPSAAFKFYWAKWRNL